MTRKDYIKIADLLAYHKSRVCLDEWNGLVDAMSNLFASDNSRFDKETFLDACGREDT
jgi:hypothetical protein